MIHSTLRCCLSALILLVVFAYARGASPRYSITQLRSVSTAAGIYSNAYDINDNGVVVGSESFARTVSPYGVDWTKTRALQWEANGNPILLPNIAGYGSEAYAINNLGKSVGMSVTTAVTSAMYGPATIFGTTASFIPNKVYARDINDAGMIVGGRVFNSGINDGFAFNSNNSTFLSLQTSGFAWGIEAVNEQSRVIGNREYFSSASVDRPAVLSTAAPSYLYATNTSGRVNAVNESNVAAGSYRPGSQGSVPAIFNGTTVTTPSYAGITGGAFLAINDRGVAVGGVYGPSGQPAVIFIDNTPLLLLSRVNTTAWTLSNAYGINNRGQIVGQGFFDHDNNTATAAIVAAFRLDPIRSPGDTNYDDVVNFADLLALAQNYGRIGNGNVFWETGDFNFDWAVNFDDLLTLAQHYTPGAIETDWALARSLVPEPTALCLVLSPFALRLRRHESGLRPPRNCNNRCGNVERLEA